MSEQFREQLSALMDGELPRDEVRFLLRRIEQDKDLAQCWARYQLAGGALRRQAAVLPLRDDFADALIQRVGAASAGYGMRILRWAGGGAIAAAVAVFALVSTRPGTNLPEAAPALTSVPPAVTAPAVPAAARLAMPLQPAFDFSQPAAAVVPLPRYRNELAAPESQEMLGPYVLLTTPQTPQRAESLLAAPRQ